MELATVRAALVEALRTAATILPEDVVAALLDAREREESPLGGAQLDAILENVKIAREGSIPMCQDTGAAVVFLKIGMAVKWDSELSVTDMVDEAFSGRLIGGDDEIELPLEQLIHRKWNAPQFSGRGNSMVIPASDFLTIFPFITVPSRSLTSSARTFGTTMPMIRPTTSRLLTGNLYRLSPISCWPLSLRTLFLL
jgi:hypothetical protein